MEKRLLLFDIDSTLISSVGAGIEALKLVMSIGPSLAGRLLLLDGRAMEWTSIRVAKSPDCPVCNC